LVMHRLFKTVCQALTAWPSSMTVSATRLLLFVVRSRDSNKGFHSKQCRRRKNPCIREKSQCIKKLQIFLNEKQPAFIPQKNATKATKWRNCLHS